MQHDRSEAPPTICVLYDPEPQAPGIDRTALPHALNPTDFIFSRLLFFSDRLSLGYLLARIIPLFF